MKKEHDDQRLTIANLIRMAARHLEMAQDLCTNIEGEGWSDLYSELGETYYQLYRRSDETKRMQITGIFKP